MLHSVAFAPREALEGDFVSTTREAFRVAHDVSAYSLVALAREAAALMTDGGSIVAMTYYGSEKVCTSLQRDGRGQSQPRSQRALSCLRPWAEKNPGELHFRRASANTRRSRYQRFHVHAETLSGTRTAKTQLRSGGVRRDRSISRQRWRCGDNRTSHLRRRRLSDNGHVTVSFGSLTRARTLARNQHTGMAHTRHGGQTAGAPYRSEDV